MAVADVERLTFAYPHGERDALRNVSLDVAAGEFVVVLGPSGSGKSTLLRALAGLVPHFHGGRFAGAVHVAGLDTRVHRPWTLAGTVASVFQDPEEQVVLTRVEAEVAFGLENIGVAPGEIRPRVEQALADVGIAHLRERPLASLSGGELQRVCLASALALRPRLLLLDEPTSQLDPSGAEEFVELVAALGIAVVCAEQRPALPLRYADRVVFMENGRVAFASDVASAVEWLADQRPSFVVSEQEPPEPGAARERVCTVDGATFSYADGRSVITNMSLTLRRGEVVALVGPNGSGKTTLAKLAAGLLDPQSGRVERLGRAGYLAQDAGRHLVTERVVEEVALGSGDVERAVRALRDVGLAGAEDRHPRDLSSGERERLALAAVLAPDPDLLVLDEPTRGVDPERKAEIAARLRRDAHRRSTLVVTHDSVFARAVADRVVALGRTREPALA